MRKHLFLTGILCVAGLSACSAHRVDMVTSHDDQLYLTTTKTTSYGPLGFMMADEVEQSVTKCVETKSKAGKPELKCLSVDVTIDGSDWEQ